MAVNNQHSSLGLFSLGTCALAGGAALTCILAPRLGWNSTAGMTTLLALSALLVIAGFGTYMLSQWRTTQVTKQFLERLAHLDYRDVTGADQDAEAIPVPHGHALEPALRILLQRFTEQCDQLQEIDHSRAAMDIRSRKSAEEHDRMAAILSTLPEPVLVVNDYEELVLANPSAERLFDLSHERAEKRALAQLVHCERLVELVTDTRRRKAAVARSDEVELTGPDGEPAWYSVTASTIASTNSNDGESSGAVAILRNISNHKLAQKRNAEFVSAVSHEMKTPLAGIKAYVELLADGDAEDEATREEFLSIINTQADRLQRLIDNLLNLARIEAGVVKVHKENRSLNELLEEALRVVQPAAERKQIHLQSDLSPLYLGVRADRDMMLQAAINLLSNAIKYTPERGRVTLRSRLADSECQFEVEDTGVGLSPEDCEKVFEKFYRVKKDSQMAPGTGLGLPLAKHIVHDVHQGRLTLTSEEGVGSTFTVTLPCAGTMS